MEPSQGTLLNIFAEVFLPDLDPDCSKVIILILYIFPEKSSLISEKLRNSPEQCFHRERSNFLLMERDNYANVQALIALFRGSLD